MKNSRDRLINRYNLEYPPFKTTHDSQRTTPTGNRKKFRAAPTRSSPLPLIETLRNYRIPLT